MELRTLVFEQPGPQNTDATLEIALARAQALGIKQAIVASSHGETAIKAARLFAIGGIKVIAVSICHGFEDVGWTMTPEERREVEQVGVKVVTGIHALGDGVGAAFTEKNGGRTPEEYVRETLYRFGQGMKVAVECLLMAADAGLLDMSAEVVSIAGTDNGADTAIICKPAYPRTFMELEVREILAKPRVP